MKNIKKRLTNPTPGLFKKIGNTCLGLGIALAGLGAGLTQYLPDNKISHILITAGGVIGVLGKFICQLTVDDTVDTENIK